MDPDWRVDTAGTGEEAVIKINRYIYGLIIADLRMPRMDGYLACERLRLDVTTRHIPVIFLTAKAQRDEIERGKKKGKLVIEFFTDDELEELVKKLSD